MRLDIATGEFDEFSGLLSWNTPRANRLVYWVDQ